MLRWSLKATEEGREMKETVEVELDSSIQFNLPLASNLSATLKSSLASIWPLIDEELQKFSAGKLPRHHRP